MEKTILDILKHELETCGLSRFEISRQTGIDQTSLFRIFHGGSCKVETADILLKFFGYDVKRREKR
jgi:predicted transcriptional regulator